MYIVMYLSTTVPVGTLRVYTRRDLAWLSVMTNVPPGDCLMKDQGTSRNCSEVTCVVQAKDRETEVWEVFKGMEAPQASVPCAA